MSRKAALTKQAATSEKEPVIVVEENEVKKKQEQTRAVKSSSVESNPPNYSGTMPSIRCSSLVDDSGAIATSDEQLEWGRALSHDEATTSRFRWQRNKQPQVAPKAASQESLKGRSGGGGGCSSQMARRFGSFSKNLLQNPFSPLRPSISTSCLFTTTATATSPPATSASSGGEDEHGKLATTAGNDVQLVCVPTRASLTHQWRKLKAQLNKCRDCNMLIYFNGRECSHCGIVAHKKCMTTLVIMCDQHQDDHHKRSDKHQTSTWPAVDSLLGPLQVATVTASPTAASIEQQQQQQQQRRGSMRRSQVAQPIFGKPILANDMDQVLDLINRFVYEIDTRGLSSRGIYRVSSIKSKVDKLCHYFDHNPSQLIDLSSFHPNIIANALKLYLRRLPEPLLTNDLYGRFIEVAKRHAPRNHKQQPRSGTPDYPKTSITKDLSSTTPKPIVRSLTSEEPATTIQQRQAYLTEPNITQTTTTTQQQNENTLDEFRRLVSSLPPVNRNILALIMRHLRRVADMAEENQMCAKNLSIIFGPTLLNTGGQQQDNKNSSLAIVDNIHQAHAIELMITWAYQIFPDTPTEASESDWQSY